VTPCQPSKLPLHGSVPWRPRMYVFCPIVLCRVILYEEHRPPSHPVRQQRDSWRPSSRPPPSFPHPLGRHLDGSTSRLSVFLSLCVLPNANYMPTQHVLPSLTFSVETKWGTEGGNPDTLLGHVLSHKDGLCRDTESLRSPFPETDHVGRTFYGVWRDRSIVVEKGRQARR
jgi:hypothetical protein